MSVLAAWLLLSTPLEILLVGNPNVGKSVIFGRLTGRYATVSNYPGGISFAALRTLFGVVVAQMFLVGFLAARVLPGERSDFIMELPPVRLPVMRNLLQKTLLRIRWHLWEAVPLFLVGTALLFVLDRTGLLGYIVAGGRPVVSGLLDLPAESAQVFVMGFRRPDGTGGGALGRPRHPGGGGRVAREPGSAGGRDSCSQRGRSLG